MRRALALLAFLAAGCSTPGTLPLAGPVPQSGLVGVTDDDAEIREYVLRNSSGMTVRFLNLGAVITAIETPDRRGRLGNVVLGYGSESEYRRLNGKNLFGAMVGRYAGRIKEARFLLDGREVRLEPNLAGNALHGGAEPGIWSKIWTVEPFRRGEVVGAVLTLTDPVGAQRLPGELGLTVTYSLHPDNSLHIEYAATTTEPTVLNLTNHSYFNLTGAGAGTAEGHVLRVFADRYVATDAEDIPTGALPAVAGTPLDLREPRVVGDVLGKPSPLLGGRGGFNHSWRLGQPDGALRQAAVLTDPVSGRRLTVETTEPSIHVYTGDYFDGEDLAPSGEKIRPRDGIALETQHLADSPNRPEFPSTVLRPGETYRSTTIWRFDSVR